MRLEPHRAGDVRGAAGRAVVREACDTNDGGIRRGRCRCRAAIFAEERPRYGLRFEHDGGGFVRRGNVAEQDGDMSIAGKRGAIMMQSIYCKPDIPLA